MHSLAALLPTLQFWQLELHVWLAGALAVRELPKLCVGLRASRRAWAGAIAAGLAAGVLTCAVAPRTSRIFYDEQIYQHIGQSLADEHRAQMCNDGVVADGRLRCNSAEYNKQPNGYPHLLSIAYRLVGVRESLAWVANNAVASLLPIVVFAIVRLLADDTLAALFAATTAALMPEGLLWSNTAASEPSAALLVAVAVMTAAWFVRARTTTALLWMVVCTSYACQFRPESSLAVVVAAGVVALGAPDELRRPRLWWGAVLGLALLVPLIAHLVVVSGQGWGATGRPISFAFVPANLGVNAPFYVLNDRFPAVYTLLALWGVLAGWRHRATWIAVVYFGLFWGVFLVFYAGSYNYGADVRYSLMADPPIAIAAGLGAAAIARLTTWPGWRAALLAGLVGPFLWFLPLVHAIGEDGWQARADVSAAREFARRVPQNGVVLTQTPSMFLFWGTNALQLSSAINDGALVRDRLEPGFAGGVYFHWGFWCTVADPVQTGFCRQFQARFPMDVVAERQERTSRYALYRVAPGR